MVKDIFNLESVEDLPESFKKELRLIGVREESKMVLNLFDIKNSLSIDEILVGLYRVNGKTKTRSWVSATLYNLSKKGLVKKITGKKGVYEKA